MATQAAIVSQEAMRTSLLSRMRAKGAAAAGEASASQLHGLGASARAAPPSDRAAVELGRAAAPGGAAGFDALARSLGKTAEQLGCSSSSAGGGAGVAGPGWQAALMTKLGQSQAALDARISLSTA